MISKGDKFFIADTVVKPGSEWGEAFTVEVRAVYHDASTYLGEDISPDYLVEVVDETYGREYEVRASALIAGNIERN